MASTAPAKHPCNNADQCSRRNCFFGHPSGDLCPSYPQQCNNYAKCACRHPPPTSGAMGTVSQGGPTEKTRRPCHFGDSCTRGNCVFHHPGGILCRFYPNCKPTNGFSCAFRHPPPAEPAPLPVVPIQLKGKSKNDGPRQPNDYFLTIDDQRSTSAIKTKISNPKTKKNSPPKPSTNIQSAPHEGGKARSKRSLEDSVDIAIKQHDRFIQNEEELMRQTVGNASRQAVAGVNNNDEQTRRTLQAKLIELYEQRAVFIEITKRIISGDGLDGVPLQEPARSHQLKRELYRFKARLPALAKRLAIERNLTSSTSRFTVIQGQTGSGKSTQIPQYAADLPCFSGKRIICSQPRKLAATSLASRVAYEYSGGWDKAQAGNDVGFRVGGRSKVSKRTKIEYVTEAVLLDMIANARRGNGSNPFQDVGCIIIDEAHERSIICDLIMGSLKENHSKWHHVKVAITSATIDLDLFSGFFDKCPVVEIPGRMFPVDIEHIGTGGITTSANVAEDVAKCALMIHQMFPGQSEGDILCFLPGQDDVLRSKDKFEAGVTRLIKASHPSERALLQRVQAHTLFGKQDADEQALVFKKTPESRKVIFSTDVAETSVTIDGVVFVIDSGLRKGMVYDPMRNMSSLKVHTISRSSALQRCGRAGRTRPGRCFRLYSLQDFNEMEIGNAAEIFQKPLSLALLTLYHVGISPQDFHWIESPNADAIKRAQTELFYLGAIDDRGSVTALGQLIAEVQVDPKHVRLIENAAQKGMTQVGVDLVAVLSIANIAYYRGKKNDKASKTEADSKRDKLLIPEQGDLVSLYRTYRAWKTEFEGADDTTEQATSPPKSASLTEDEIDEDENEEQSDTWSNMLAKSLLQVKINASEAAQTAAMLLRLDGFNDADTRDSSSSVAEGDDDNVSVISAGSEISCEIDGSILTTKPKKLKQKLNEKKARAWCIKNGVNSKAMHIAYAMAKDLVKTLSKAKSWSYGIPSKSTIVEAANDELRRLITCGFFLNAAVSKPQNGSTYRRGGPQYYALYSSVLGSLFMGTAVHLFEKQGSAVPSWILYDSVLRLNDTTFLSLATPIEEDWIKEESPTFFRLCMRNRDELPVETIIFSELSLTLLKSLFGKSFQQINRWESQLKCTMSIDRDAGTITVFCAPVHASEIKIKLGGRITALKQRLESETTEMMYMGTTRAIIASGYKVQELLFDKEFSTISIRNLPDIRDREVEQLLLQWTQRAGYNASVIRSVDVLRNNNSGSTSVSATVKFLNKNSAQKVFDFVRGDNSGGSGDSVIVTPVRVMGDASNVSAIGTEFAGRIKLTWADGEATGDAKVFFRSALDANAFVRSAAVVLQSTSVKASAIGQRNDAETTTSNALPTIGRAGPRTPPRPKVVGAASPNKHLIAAPPAPSAPVRKEIGGAGYWIVYDTEAIDRMPLEVQARLRFCVNLKGGIPPSMDEVELMDRIRPTTPTVAYAKIARKPLAASKKSDESMAKELEVRFSRMLPLLTCLDETAVHTDYVDQGTRRAGVVVFCRDLARLNETFQLARDSPLWSELEKPHGQPIRMEIEHSYTTSLHTDMHRCFRDQITQVFMYARARGVMCDESLPKSLGSASKNMATLKFLGELPVLKRIKAKLEEIMSCERVESPDLHLLFSATGRYTVSRWMDKHIDEEKLRLRYFIRWIWKRNEYWVYGDAPSRAHAIEKLLQLARDIKAQPVQDQIVRILANKTQKNSNIRGWLAKAPTASALFSCIPQTDRRLVISGTEEQCNALVQALEADGLLYKPRKNARSQDDTKLECGICTDTAVEPYVGLMHCNHIFCLDCIQPMLSSGTIELPILCPHSSGCRTPLHVDDIAKIVDADAVSSIVETAVFNYAAKNKTAVLVCPKPGCNQIISTTSITGGERDAVGGRCIYCDQCQASYCLDCTEAAGGHPIPRHKNQSCQDFRSRQASPQVAQHLRYIQDQILNVSCPHCRSVFLDFSGCTSVQCGNATCGHFFCANCLVYSSTSSGETHYHVQRCPSNPNPANSDLKGYFVTDEQLAAVHRGLRQLKIEAYFRDQLVSETTRGDVYKHISKDLEDLGLTLPPDLRGKSNGFYFEEAETPQDAQTRRHVNHIREKLLNLRCPKCNLVFVDFDFDSCAALTCANPQCKSGFCAYCLVNCGDDAHQHVSSCSKNPNRPYYYVTEEQFKLVHKQRREGSITSYLRDDIRGKEGALVAQRVHAALADDFRRIGVEIPMP